MKSYTVEVVLRDRDVAISEVINAGNAPREWTEFEVEDVLREILRAIDRAQNPGAPPDKAVALRGFSWIVEPSDGGVVIAIEIPMGAAVAGPFDVEQEKLDALVTSALRRQTLTPGTTIH
jgi:hypothetical protein